MGERWNKISGVQCSGKGNDGNLGYVGRKIGGMNRPRNFIHAVSLPGVYALNEHDRKLLLQRFRGYKTKAVIMLEPPVKKIELFERITLPEETETFQFDSIEYVI